jgi:hypothetical protein
MPPKGVALDPPRRSQKPPPGASGFDFPSRGEFAENVEEVMPQLKQARFRLDPGIVNLVTTVYIRAEL